MSGQAGLGGQPDQGAGLRLLMLLVGALAGACLWYLLDQVPDIIGKGRLLLFLVAFAGGFFAVLLGVLGPLRLAPAVALAGGLAGLGAGLLTWASARFDDIGNFLQSGHVVLAWLLILTIPVPFALAARTGRGWRDYPALFHGAWRLVVRYLVAWLFVGVVWGVVILSDQVLRVVGIGVIGDLLERDPVPWVLSGAALGLGLAVVHELGGWVSPQVVVRLLRLLLPVVLLVAVVFVVAAPVRGLSRLFGGVSAAAMLMALAGLAVTLITAVVDADEAEAARAPLLRGAARLLAVLVVVLGALAAWAVWLRVAQYGWTPRRLTAAVAAGVVLAYGVGYAQAALRPGWRARIRRVNIWLALGLVAVAALWLTPVLDAERIAARSQLARFEAGLTEADQLDLWALGHEWGRAGQAALARLSDPDHPRADELAPALARLEQVDSRWQWRQQVQAAGSARAALRALLPVRPQGAHLPEDAFEGAFEIEDWRAACTRRTPAGNPGCVAIVGDFLAAAPGDEVAVVFLDTQRRVRVAGWARGNRYLPVVPVGDVWRDPAVIDRILAGQVKIPVTSQDSLVIGEKTLVLNFND